MHEQWDPVTLEMYLREIAAANSAESAGTGEASSRRRAVLSRTLTDLSGGPVVDLSRNSTAIDLSFN